MNLFIMNWTRIQYQWRTRITITLYQKYIKASQREILSKYVRYGYYKQITLQTLLRLHQSLCNIRACSKIFFLIAEYRPTDMQSFAKKHPREREKLISQHAFWIALYLYQVGEYIAGILVHVYCHLILTTSQTTTIKTTTMTTTE